MNKNINLCDILKGHEGETFYSKALGCVKLHKVFSNSLIILALKHNRIGFEINVTDAIKDIVPSKDQRDWNKWDKENNHKAPKTWSELIKTGNSIYYTACTHIEDDNTPIVKAAKALLKIHQIIEVGYGGNVTDEEWNNKELPKFVITPVININNDFNIVGYSTYTGFLHIAFHEEKQAGEFLSYPENVQLIKDYFMIND